MSGHVVIPVQAGSTGESLPHIVHLCKYYPPLWWGGVPCYVQLAVQELSRYYRVTVLSANSGWKRSEESRGNLRVIRVPRVTEIRSTTICPTLPWELVRLRPDVIHLHFPDPMAHLAYAAARVSGKLVITWHGDISRQWFLLHLYRPFLRWIFRSADRIIVSSPAFRDGSRLLEGFRERCTVIPFGIDVERFRLNEAVERTREVLRQRFGERVVLFVGRLHEQKGLDYLLRAMVGLNARLVLVGTGYMERTLRRLAVELGLGDRVAFEGELPPSEIVPYLYLCSLLVLPSVNTGESFGLVQLEAMACGKPVVSTNIPTGVPWVNQHGRTGLVVPPRDPDALRSAIRQLLDDPSLRQNLGEAGRKRVESQFTLEQHIRQILNVYATVLAQGN